MRRVIRRLIVLIIGVASGLLVLSGTQPLLADPALQTTDTSGDPIIIGAGDISECNNDRDLWTSILLDSAPGATIVSIGDNAYESGSPQEFRDCYGPTWGRFKDRIKPVPGNHEYITGGAFGYFDYFGDVATPLEPGCRKECGGYYSFDVGTWHVVALNSEINGDPGSPQEQWLRVDLAANPSVCTLAYWHKPRFTSGYHGGGAGQALFQALYEYGADIVLSGHDHDYERFAPQDPSGQYAPDRGIRQFVVGTGGDSLRDYKFIQPDREVRNAETWGVLKLTLHPTSYDWQFLPIEGQTFTDSGTSPCVTAPGVATERTAAVVEQTPAVTTVAEPAVNVSGDTELVDVATATPATAAAASTTAAATPVAGASYTIQEGDTLFGISLRYDVSWTDIAAANGLTEDSLLQIGQVIKIPGVDDTATAASSAAIPAATTATTATVASTGMTTTTAAANTTSGAPSVYTVRIGDTLFGIAIRYGITRRALAEANGITETAQVVIGQKLTIPGQGGATASASSSSTALAATGTTTGTLAGGSATGTISGTTASTTSTSAATIPAATASTRYYTVESGDTIISIALANNVDWQEVLRLNGMTETSLLQIGQKIRLN